MKEKITILHIIEGLNDFGGTANKLLMLSRYMDKNKYHFIFVVSDDNGKLKLQFEDLGVEVIKVNTNILSSTYLVSKIIIEKNVDLVSTHFNRAHIIGTAAAFLTGKKLIQNEHGFPRGSHAKKNIVYKKFIYYFEKLTFRLKDAYIINSNTVKDVVVKDIGQNNAKLLVVQNAIDTEKFNNSAANENLLRSKYSISADTTLFGSIGGFIGLRDFLTAIKATKKLLDEGYPVYYFICGDGSGRKEIEELIINLSLQKHVILLGYNSNIPQFLTEMDIYIYPVLTSAGIGLGLLEPMFMKKPVISFAQGAETEMIIKNDEQGYNISQYDVTEMAEKMKFFINNPEEKYKMGRNGSELIEKYYSGKRYASDVTEIYDKVLNPKSSQSEKVVQWSY